MSETAKRLDNFTDAAFAFAVTLLVVGGGADGPPDYPALIGAMAGVPAFLIGFAIIAVFWYAHVRWRVLRGEGGMRSILLTVLLVFLVLVYVYPLRAMSISFAAFLSGRPSDFGGYLGELFFIYGVGFGAMSATIALLYADAFAAAAPGSLERREARGQVVIWAILVATAIVSVVLTLFRATEFFAPLVYATLPISTTLYSARYDWRGERA